MATLSEILKKIRDKAKEVKERGQILGDSTTPSQADKDYVDERLEDITSDVDVILGSTSPSLPAGTSTTATNPAPFPSSRIQVCQDCEDLAQAAYTTETGGLPVDHDLIGENVSTIKTYYVPEIRDRFEIA